MEEDNQEEFDPFPIMAAVGFIALMVLCFFGFMDFFVGTHTFPIPRTQY